MSSVNSQVVTKTDKEVCGAVLVCGAGVAGIQASLDLSAAGFKVYLAEEKPAIGGAMARLDKTFPTGDCATCIISPKLVECVRDLNIELITMSEVVGLEGEPGNFKATLKQRPRYIDLNNCTACGECTKVCPVELPSSFDGGMGKRKAVDKVYAQAAPNIHVINKKGRAPCSSGCPIDQSVQAYVNLIAAGKVKEAADIIWRENPLPSICGRACFHPCESECNRNFLDESINIRDLKRYAIEKFPKPDAPADLQKTGKKVAIAGSGPAGLAAAQSLALMGHDTTVFEALPVLGGMLAVGIPDYRLPPEILKRDIDTIGSLGVTFKTETAVGKDIPVDTIKTDYDALFISTGAHNSRKLEIPGEESRGVIHGIDFLRTYSLKEKVEIGDKVVVVGGGNTAIDAARTAIRLGADNVKLLYRRTREEMPADEIEIDAMLHEGATIEFLVTPVTVNADNGKVTSIECIRMELGEPDDSGRRRPVPIEGSEFTVAVDTLIPAVSQAADEKLSSLFGLKLTRWATVKTDEITLASSQEGIFAGGDVVLGPSSIIDSIEQGKRAARGIDNYLNGRALDEGLTKRHQYPNPLDDDELAKLKRSMKKESRVPVTERQPDARIKDFTEVESVYTDEEAVQEALRCLKCSGCCECMLCVKACENDAVRHEEQEKTIELDIGAVILTPGFDAFNAERKGEYGFGYAQNVMTNVQFERILSASGPTLGKIVRPSDAKKPKRIAFIQCVGSRDSSCGNEYCSSVCCMAATKEAILIKEHVPDCDVTIFFLDMRAFGKDFDRYYERAQNMGITYVRSFISRTYEMPDTKNLGIVYLDSAMKLVEEEFDMVVLSVGLEPSESLRKQATAIGVELNTGGFAQTGGLTPLDTTREGVYVGGVFQEPKDIPDTVMQATGAAARAMTLLAPARGSLVRTKIYPPERDITDEPPRIGVFVCHCGSNIASVVDVKKVTEYAKTLPNVAFADDSVYACADDSQGMIKDIIKEHQLNRVIIASCTPRTHEPIFRDTLRDAGLNPYLLEMANIRDQCSWVHSDDHEAATEKSMQLVKMTIGRTANLVSLKDSKVPVKPGALVIGGGIAGMSAALALSSQGFPVHLVEKTDQLGGLMHHLHKTVEGDDIQAYLKNTIEQVIAEPKINVYLHAQAKQVDGHIGEFKTIIADGTQDFEIEHGVVVVATGANEKKPVTYGYGSSESVLTQLELSDKLGNGGVDLPDNGSVVMIQCVEQRNEEHPYCSRVCCTTAIKNALQIKEAKPDASVVIIYRDIRTYGFKEIVYKEAREKGILFVRYNEDEPPLVKTDKGLSVSVKDLSLYRTIEINPDLLVLAAPIRPQEDRDVISDLLKVPLNADGFFLEAHVKLRPVDFASEGLFLCGTAHAPKFVKEVIAQANAVAGRAGSILSRREMAVSGQIAWVDPNKCISCMTCVHVCPYMAPMVGRENKAEVQSAVCMGCGSCTAACPAKAITLHHYVDTQVLGAIDNLLQERPEERKEEPVFLEKVGIALPKWHRK